MVKLGQHFMVDKNVLRKVVGYAHLDWNDTVLEIGAGEGALTEELRKKCRVIAIEKDDKLFIKVKEKFPDHKIINGDALKIEWPQFDKCVSNLPYSISKPFVLKLLQHDFQVAVLVLQKEFAEKLAAKPGSKNYGVTSVCAQACCDIELLDKVPRNAFKPQPHVTSQIVRLKLKKTLDRDFLGFVTEVFQLRNKKAGEKRVFQLTPHELFAIYGEYQREKAKIPVIKPFRKW